jgi:D-alanyl-D-alanine carboxypeptidase
MMVTQPTGQGEKAVAYPDQVCYTTRYCQCLSFSATAMTRLPGPYRIFCRVAPFVVLFALFAAGSTLAEPVESSAVVPDIAAGLVGQQLDELRETVEIDGSWYLIPPPWAGSKIDPPHFTWESFRQIPVEFTHQGAKIYIVAKAHPPLLAMLEQARQDGIELRVVSGYRSARYQRQIFKRMMAEGRSFADIVRYVAPPGYSEHMLGTAVDFYPSNWAFADTPAYGWLQEHAAGFGFIETYSEKNRWEMPWEAWHWNYVGGDSTL